MKPSVRRNIVDFLALCTYIVRLPNQRLHWRVIAWTTLTLRAAISGAIPLAVFGLAAYGLWRLISG